MYLAGELDEGFMEKKIARSGAFVAWPGPDMIGSSSRANNFLLVFMFQLFCEDQGMLMAEMVDLIHLSIPHNSYYIYIYIIEICDFGTKYILMIPSKKNGGG